jgi:hypothetical protein
MVEEMGGYNTPSAPPAPNAVGATDQPKQPDRTFFLHEQ